jgi:hypothetical protein
MIDELRRMRRLTSQTLVETLQELSSGATEAMLRDAWSRRLYAHAELADAGWYTPPPSGIIFVSDSEPEYQRVNHASFRTSEAWPSYDVRPDLDRSLIYAYASPVNRRSGVIGDLGCSLYGGSDERLRAHLVAVWDVTRRIIDIARPGMTFPQLYEKGMRLIEESGLRNMVHSVHAGSSTDIGHLVPWSDLPPDTFERDVLAGGALEALAELVSKNRRFISATDDYRIGDDVAFTIEPRLCAPGLPMVGFHTITGFVGGEQHTVFEFDALFEMFDMRYLTVA